MLAARRFLPSLSLLTAFEAAARTGSVTAAARELDLTQSAVSRQIKALESQLGVELFLRERQTIRLTVAGDSYAREIREALRRISSASLNLRANPHGGTLNLAILPTFGTRWLMPRMPGFLKQNPGLTVNFATRIGRIDFDAEGLDAAIHVGKPDWPGCDFRFLMHEHVVPVCSPDFLKENPVDRAEALTALPLLEMASRPEAWHHWFSTLGVKRSHREGMRFEQFMHVSQACIAGLGVALMPLFLIEAELNAGSLVKAVDRTIESRSDYFFVTPANRRPHAAAVRFSDWLAAEIDRAGLA